MESGSEFYAGEGLQIDPKWLIDPKLLFVGPRIGEGGHAKVYEGKYKNQNVAIKIVHKGDTPEEMAKREGRFLREVTMLSRVQHKNLVKFIGACLEPVMVVVTELLVGGSLRKYLVGLRPRSLEPRVAVGFALDIARAMECLHAHGIIHRDLKPENLLLTADQRTIKLVDLGLAREETLTEMMTAETGTYRWMAPENIRPSADNLPAELSEILSTCWKEDPNERPNFTQIVQMLLHYLSTLSPPERLAPPRTFSSENAILPPESPGTSSLMASRGDLGDTPKGKMEDKPRGFFFCFSQCY
uniref:Protein kinase domain-containing protein n=1 Tax=Leersia perrieri TaxID=77586 RepID=A0A0D9VHS1_9ORYZ